MKFTIFLALVFSSNLQAAAEKKTPTIKIKSNVTKVMLLKDKIYKVDLAEYAAVYYAEEDLLACLNHSINKQKAATLVVDPKTMKVVKCE